jgi:hypothetical protein
MARILPLSVRWVVLLSLTKNEDIPHDSPWGLCLKS